MATPDQRNEIIIRNNPHSLSAPTAPRTFAINPSETVLAQAETIEEVTQGLRGK
jgi:hypothetical protein